MIERGRERERGGGGGGRESGCVTFERDRQTDRQTETERASQPLVMLEWPVFVENWDFHEVVEVCQSRLIDGKPLPGFQVIVLL